MELRKYGSRLRLVRYTECGEPLTADPDSCVCRARYALSMWRGDTGRFEGLAMGLDSKNAWVLAEIVAEALGVEKADCPACEATGKYLYENPRLGDACVSCLGTGQVELAWVDRRRAAAAAAVEREREIDAVPF